MNKLQNIFLDIIFKISNIDGVFDYGTDTMRGFQNYIGRHSLANDSYYISEEAFKALPTYNLTLPLQRSKLKDFKPYFTYEHPVPKKIVTDWIKTSTKSLAEIRRILEFADCVTLITKNEDKKLSKCTMPDKWKCLESSQFARYETQNIIIRSDKIPVTGRILV